MNKYADLEFLSLADRIVTDYKSLLRLVSEADEIAESPIDTLSFRILIEIHHAEEPLSSDDIAVLMRLDKAVLTRALVKLIGHEYVRSESSRQSGADRFIHLTESGRNLAQKYERYIDGVIKDQSEMSPLLLSEAERDIMLLALIDLQNRSAALLEKHQFSNDLLTK